jgi:hypothetical protein
MWGAAYSLVSLHGLLEQATHICVTVIFDWEQARQAFGATVRNELSRHTLQQQCNANAPRAGVADFRRLLGRFVCLPPVRALPITIVV